MIDHRETDTEGARLLTDEELRKYVKTSVATTPVVDIHTHIFPHTFSGLFLSGIDNLLTYHYLVAETFRSSDISPAKFWQLTNSESADIVWQSLFVRNTPLSEASRGVVTVLDAFGLDPRARDLREARAFFNSLEPSEHIDRVLELAGVRSVVMTNDPLHEVEARYWRDGVPRHQRFRASLRLDSLLNDWTSAVPQLIAQEFRVTTEFSPSSRDEVKRFLDEWIARLDPLYLAVSLPAVFRYPGGDVRERILTEAVIPTAIAHDLPLALMIGVRRNVNPELRVAGDGSGYADVSAVERLCAAHPELRFLVTFLSRENQHELCVAARKFKNLMPFGCWWFLNNPSIISEITAERFEMLGLSFIPQHSDARVLEQLIYKWRHSRTVIADELSLVYRRLLESGRGVTRSEVSRDVMRLFSGNFLQWVNRPDELRESI